MTVVAKWRSGIGGMWSSWDGMSCLFPSGRFGSDERYPSIVRALFWPPECFFFLLYSGYFTNPHRVLSWRLLGTRPKLQ